MPGMAESKKEMSKMLRITQISWTLLATLTLMGNAMAIEEAKYKVLREENGFELREYDSHILAETTVDGAFEDAGNQAFNRLFKYISGNNKEQQKVAMTTPVGQEPLSQKIEMTSPVGQQERDGKWVVSFMMPASFTLKTTPEPKDPNVSIREVPPRLVAAVRYSGLWSEKSYRQNLAKLQDWTANNRLSPSGEPIWARYNPPLMPWFLRRNEILLPVASPKAGS
jgi:effector-binding domain-containing protein